MPKPVAIAILAAGLSRRFGGDKLMADLNGKPVGLHIAHNICLLPSAPRYAICRDDMPDLIGGYRQAGFDIVINNAPDEGLSSSLKLAIRAAMGSDATALLICLADMPFISAGHLGRIIAEFRKYGDAVASSAFSRRQPPALFPRNMWPTMLELTGDIGGRNLLQNARHIEMPGRIITDIDTAEDLAAAKNCR